MTRPFAPLIAFPLLLVACGQQTATPDNTAAANAAAVNAATPEEGFVQRVRALPAGQRDGVFLRAVRDGKGQCQEVTEEYEVANIPADNAWAVTCDRTNHWLVTIDENGVATVTAVSAASRLPRKTS